MHALVSVSVFFAQNYGWQIKCFKFFIVRIMFGNSYLLGIVEYCMIGSQFLYLLNCSWVLHCLGRDLYKFWFVFDFHFHKLSYIDSMMTNLTNCHLKLYNSNRIRNMNCIQFYVKYIFICLRFNWNMNVERLLKKVTSFEIFQIYITKISK